MSRPLLCALATALPARLHPRAPIAQHTGTSQPSTSTRPSHSAAAAAALTQPHHLDSPPPRDAPESAQSSAHSAEADAADDARFADHLNDVLSPLAFPPQLAKRLMTHGSHPAAALGHNARFSFIGRRVLEAYLLLFLHSCGGGTGPDHAHAAALALNTYTLGEHVAPAWRLGRVLRWVPTVPAGYAPKPGVAPPPARARRAQERDGRRVRGARGGDFGPEILQSVGLYKVHGEAVQAVVGGAFHQFGGSVAQRLFHTRVLPHVLLPGRPQGLHDAFHDGALRAAVRMGRETSGLLGAAGRR